MSANYPNKIPDVDGWDDEQKRVIRSAPAKRLLVDAGPGTGKTAVACGRLAYLISEQDLEPTNVWMISFTRTAVSEIRTRLCAYVGSDAFAIKIATIDSHAWSMHSGHDPNSSLTGSYEQNIERVIELVRDDLDIADELDEIEHLVVDEAQDLVGPRANLIELIIDRLPSDCGVTIFLDEAQSIYGFADKSYSSTKDQFSEQSLSLIDRIRNKTSPAFEALSLTKIYRTSSAGLMRIFSDVRHFVLDKKNHVNGFHSAVRKKIQLLSTEQGLTWKELHKREYGENSLLLFRSRGEVLWASRFCNQPHRLRLSGYGEALPSWLAICFFDYTERFVSEEQFHAIWSMRIDPISQISYHASREWIKMVKLAGRNDKSVDLHLLRKILGRNRPPIEFAEAEYGLPGPILGTIHASKGREADRVFLLMPSIRHSKSVEWEAEEARVLFVGATRARVSLSVGEPAPIRFARIMRSGRIWYRSGIPNTFLLEVGIGDDLLPRNLVGRSEFTRNEAATAQKLFADISGEVAAYKLVADPNPFWRYKICADSNGVLLGVLSESFDYDLRQVLFHMSKFYSHHAPFVVNKVKSQGCASIVLAPDDQELEWLNEPWASSGFLLRPKIVAFPTFELKQRKV